MEADQREEKLEQMLGQQGSKGVEDLEKLIDVASRELCLHPTHALVMRTKSLLLSLLGSSPGHLYHQLSAEQVQRKAQLCTEFIQVMHKVDPGNVLFLKFIE